VLQLGYCMPRARTLSITHCAYRIIFVPTVNQTLILWSSSPKPNWCTDTLVPHFIYFTFIPFDGEVIGRFGGDINFTVSRTQWNHM